MVSGSIPHASVIRNLQENAKQARSELIDLLGEESRNYEALMNSLTTYVENLKAADTLKASQGKTSGKSGDVKPKKQSSGPLEGANPEIDDDATVLASPPDKAQDDDATLVDNSKRPGLKLTIKPVDGSSYSLMLDGTKDKYGIGRKKSKKSDPDIDVALSDISVSSRHCEITWGNVDGGWMIEDLGATNCTKLEGEEIKKVTQLPDHAEIVVGETSIHLNFT